MRSLVVIEVFIVTLIIYFYQCTESFIMRITTMDISPYLHMYLDHHCTLPEIIITTTLSMPRMYFENVMMITTFSVYVETIILVTASHYVKIVTLVTVIKVSSHYAETTIELPLQILFIIIMSRSYQCLERIPGFLRDKSKPFYLLQSC